MTKVISETKTVELLAGNDIVPVVRPCELGRRSFNEKKDTYFFKDLGPALGSVSKWAITQTVAEVQRWTPEEVERRTKDNVTELCSQRVWDLDLS